MVTPQVTLACHVVDRPCDLLGAQIANSPGDTAWLGYRAVRICGLPRRGVKGDLYGQLEGSAGYLLTVLLGPVFLDGFRIPASFRRLAAAQPDPAWAYGRGFLTNEADP